jgi:hypothetical protein
MFVSSAVLAATLALTPAAAQGRDTRPPQTDQTVPVSRGSRLDVSNFAGEVIVRTWDKDTLRVVARHRQGTRVSIRPGSAAVAIQSSTSSGPSGSVDYEITAPAWMPVRVEGTYAFITVEGTHADVSAENVRGDIVIKGVTGAVTARSIEGEVIVEGARGRIAASSVNEGVRVADASGEITVETTNGGIALSGVESASLEAATVNGDITFDGRTTDRGRYRFTSHNGDIVMSLPETANATITVRSYQGDFRSSLALKGPPVAEVRGGRRVSYTLGTGSAEVEVETFSGDIRVRRPGDASDKGRTKDKDKNETSR